MSVQTWRGAVAAVGLPSLSPRGCVFTVCEEHGVLIDERPEGDSPLNMRKTLRRLLGSI